MAARQWPTVLTKAASALQPASQPASNLALIYRATLRGERMHKQCSKRYRSVEKFFA